MNERLIDTEAETTVTGAAKELTRLIDEERMSKERQKRSKTRPGEEVVARRGGAITLAIAHPKFLEENMEMIPPSLRSAHLRL